MRFSPLSPRPAVSIAALLCVTLWPSALVAHPHIFIDAGLRLVMEDGHVTAVEVTWLYDELYTLILIEDNGLDPDFDLILTEEEVAQMLGFDLTWTHGFEGGLAMHRGDAELQLGAPEPVSLELIGDGQIRTTHRRAVMDVDGAGALVTQVYDPEFFVAFEMTGEMSVAGADCAADLQRADLDAAYEALEVAMDSIGGAVSAEDNFPVMGELFADRVVFECAG